VSRQTRRPTVGDGSAEVVSIGIGGTHRPDNSRLACGAVAAARRKLNMDRAAFARHISEVTEWDELPETIKAWEDDVEPPGSVVMACVAITQGVHALDLPLLAGIPPQFPAQTLAGPWVTTYLFDHADTPHHHADIAVITAESESRIRAVNHPPEPRSEGRSRAFRNEIAADLAGRHLVGAYVNTSDRRYFGSVQLAVHSGETVMEGIYGGVGSDVEVSDDRWKWVRLDADPADLAGVVLRDPVELYELVMARTRNDAPLALDDVRES
jgi:hypothetical protein